MPEHHDEFHTLTKPYGPCAPTCPHPDHRQTTTEQAALTDLERRILEDGWVEQDFTGIRLAVERIVAERLAAVRALAQQWNDTPDYIPSSYDMGRVAQRHDMTTQLWEVLGDA